MKKVWILNHYAQEPGGAGGTRHYHLAQYLKLYGWDATIIAASVDHVTGKQRLNAHEKHRLEILNDVEFLWVNTPSYAGNGGGRIHNMLSYTKKVLNPKTTAEIPRPDIVIGSSVHPLAAVAGALIARKHKVAFIFEVRDLWPQSLIDIGRLRENSLTVWVLRKLETWLYKTAARIIVLGPYTWKYISPLGIPNDRIIWIPNGVDLSLYAQPKIRPNKSKDTFTLMYFGAHGNANGLDNILKAMALIQEMPGGDKIKLRLIGDGPLKPNLIQMAESLKLHNVNFESAVPKNQIPTLAAQADAFVIAVLDLPKLYRYGISMNKLFDYLAASRPILIASSAANNPVKEAEAGFTVEPNDPQALAREVIKMASLPLTELERMGNNGRAYVEKFHNFSHLAEKLAKTLDAAIDSRFSNNTIKH